MYSWSISFLVYFHLVCLGLQSPFGFSLSGWIRVFMVIGWRVMYNGGLGILLHAQSKNGWMVNVYKEQTEKRTKWGWVMEKMAESGYKGHCAKNAPACLNAWLAWRHLVDFVLMNDAFNYVFLCWSEMDWNEPYNLIMLIYTTGGNVGWKNWLVFAQYLFGIFLCVFNYWAKIDAHRCIGDFAWYWEDFFYRVPQELKFDGIFEYFPHPMYTVGYAMHYGAALITRSYTILVLALWIHLSQLLFLVLVENPHIEKIYGLEKNEAIEEQRKILYDPATGLFPDKQVGVRNISLLRSSDFALVLIAIYVVVVTLLMDSIYVLVHATIWRCIHWLFLGSVLYFQANGQFFTKYYQDHHRSLFEAFENWKRMYNLSYVINYLCFFVTAFHFFDVPQWPLSMNILACWLGGVFLIVVNIWSALGSFEALGDFGFYYGDFFIPKSEYRPRLVYTGIYRFLNNPDCMIGYAGLHGIALICRSWEMFGLALLAQTLNIAFLYLVEIPYMQKLYADQSIRKANPLQVGLSTKIKSLENRAYDIQKNALQQIYDVYKRLGKFKDEAAPDEKRALVLEVPESIAVGEALIIKFQPRLHYDAQDWIGVYEANVASTPGVSEGRWLYIGYPTSGSLVFPSTSLPCQDKSGGVCEVRYHSAGTYSVLARKALMIMPTFDSKEVEQGPASHFRGRSRSKTPKRSTALTSPLNKSRKKK